MKTVTLNTQNSCGKKGCSYVRTMPKMVPLNVPLAKNLPLAKAA
jgi:hypothetical protein